MLYYSDLEFGSEVASLGHFYLGFQIIIWCYNYNSVNALQLPIMLVDFFHMITAVFPSVDWKFLNMHSHSQFFHLWIGNSWICIHIISFSLSNLLWFNLLQLLLYLPRPVLLNLSWCDSVEGGVCHERVF